MFSWFRRKATPASKDSPGSEPDLPPIDATRILASVLAPTYAKTAIIGEWLELDNGLMMRPQIEGIHARDDGATRTVSIIEIAHADLCPDGLFEYQHATGNTPEDSLRQGFTDWRRIDLPVFEDALRSKDKELMSMQMDLPGVKRQIVFGPTVHYASREAEDPKQEKTFCPCCLFTNCTDAFREQLEQQSFYGIRLFASRNAEGVAGADCRINGQHWQAGQQALLKYVESWPERGFEFRKQFVAIRTVPGETTASAQK